MIKLNVIDDLVENYNTSYHSGIKMIPDDFKNNDEKVIKLTTKKYNLALQEETVFNIGDNVRCIINLKSFEKKVYQNGVKQFIKLFQIHLTCTLQIIINIINTMNFKKLMK